MASAEELQRAIDVYRGTAPLEEAGVYSMPSGGGVYSAPLRVPGRPYSEPLNVATPQAPPMPAPTVVNQPDPSLNVDRGDPSMAASHEIDMYNAALKGAPPDWLARVDADWRARNGMPPAASPAQEPTAPPAAAPAPPSVAAQVAPRAAPQVPAKASPWEEARDAWRSAQEQRQANNTGLLETIESGRKARGELAAASRAKETDAAKADEARFAEYAAERDAIQQEYEREQQALGSVEIVDRRTRSEKAMGAIAIALSGLGDAFAMSAGREGGGAQRVASMISSQINRDLEMQRENLANKRTASAAKLTLLGQMREQYGDEVSASERFRANRMRQYAGDLGEIAANTADAQASAQIRDASLQLGQAANQMDMEWAEKRAAERRAAASADPLRKWRGASMQQLEEARRNGTLPAEIEARFFPKEEATSEVDREIASLAGDSKEELVAKRNAGQMSQEAVNHYFKTAAERVIPDAEGTRIPGGLVIADPGVYQKLGAPERRALSEVGPAANQMLRRIDEIIALREKRGLTEKLTPSSWTEIDSRIESLSGMLAADVKSLQKLGAYDNGVEKLKNSQFGNANSIFSSTTDRLKQAREEILSDVNTTVSSMGAKLDMGGPLGKLTGEGGGTIRMQGPGGVVRDVTEDQARRLEAVGGGGRWTRTR